MAEIPEIFSSAGNVDLGQPKESLSSEHEFARLAQGSRKGPTLSGELTESIVKKKSKGAHPRKVSLIKRISKQINLPRKSRNPEEQHWNNSTRFSRQQLVTATNNFDPSMLIHVDSRTTEYKGYLPRKVVVKRYEVADKEDLFLSEVADKEDLFLSEALALSVLSDHPNIVKGIGWCREGKEFYIVREFTENGTLSDHLHLPDRDPIPWDLRLKITRDLASAILYMHDSGILHRGIKSRNVLLDANFNAKLASFKYSLFQDAPIDHVVTKVLGTRGYLDPECRRTGVFSRGSDVYSFGVVVLEIATGKRATVADFQGTGMTTLVEWVRDLYGSFRFPRHGEHSAKEAIAEVADERLKGAFDPAQMQQLINLGLSCTSPSDYMRPPIEAVLQFLESGVLRRKATTELETSFPLEFSSPRSEMTTSHWVDSPFRDSAKAKQTMEQSEFHEEPIAAGETWIEIEDSIYHGDDVLTEDFDTGIPPHYKESGPLRDSQPQTMQNFIDTLREDKESGKEPTAAAETFGDTEKPILGDELTEEFDIGIPPHYKESGPLRDSQRQIMQSFIDALREDMELGKGFFNVLDSIKVLTSVLVGLHAPLADWNSLAQYVLREVRRIENLRRKHEGEGYQKTRSLSSVQAKFEECRATVGEDSAKLGELKENLISLEQEHASSTSRFEDLQKQLVDLQNQMEDLEGTLNLSQDKVDAISHWRRQNIERIEYLELAILTLHESLLSRFSSSDFGGKITQSSDVRNSGKKEMLPDAAHLLHLERQTKVEMP